MSDQTATSGTTQTSAGAGSAASAPWYAGIEQPDLKGWVESKGFKDPASVAESAWNLEKLLGHQQAGRTVVWPKDENDADGWKAVRSRLGVPERPDDYKIPDALKDDPLIGAFRELAHGAHVPGAAFEKIVTSMLEKAEALAQQEEATFKSKSASELEALKAEWGNEFDQKAEYARRFLRAEGWDDAKIATYEKTFGTATMLKDFFSWGSRTAEQAYVPGKGGGAAGKAEISAKIQQLREDRLAGKVTDNDFHAQMQTLGAQLEAVAA